MKRMYTIDGLDDGDGKSYGSFLETYQQFSSSTMTSQLAKRHRQGQSELEPYCESVFAAVLFADISGFTRLSARLSEEELKFHINEYFSALLGVVEENNGDTIKFCGDAVMIMWSVDTEAEDEVKAAAVLMASVCALQLLGDCGIYDRGEGTHAVSLRLHCGIGCGVLHCMCMGDGLRWEYLISGDPIRQVGLAGPEAGIGGVCLSPEAYQLIQNKLDAEEMPKGNFKLTGALAKGRNPTSTMAIMREAGSLDNDEGCDSFEQLPVHSVDETNLFSKDGYSIKNSTTLDLSKLSGAPSSNDDLSEDLPLRTKRQVNEKYAPIGGGSVDIYVSPTKSKGSSGSDCIALKSGQITPDVKLQAMSILEPESNSIFPEKPQAETKPVGCFGCLLKPDVATQAENLPVDSSCADKSHKTPQKSWQSSSTGISSSPGGSPGGAMIAKKRSFIKDLSFRMKRGTDSFIFNRLAMSNRNLDYATSPGVKVLNVNTIKSAFNIASDPHVEKVRSYLSDLSKGDISVKEEPKVTKTLSTFGSGRILDKDRNAMAKMLRCFINEAALKAIDSNLSEFGYLAETRVVVTIFIELNGLEEDFRLGNVKRPQRAMAFALACINRFEGSLRQYVVDDKGCVLIAAFGLPGSHHEDNCTRAIETAKAIQKSLLLLHITCSTGIAMGSVYCGLVGSSSRCEYAMMGSSVNLAARLMVECSPGHILVSDSVHQGASQDFEFETLEPITAKGYENKVDVYSPLTRVQSRAQGLGNRSNQHCQFVGRNEEKLMFQQDLLKFGYGENDMERTIGHIIEGPPGIGKTSLVSEINNMAISNANISAIVISSASASHVSSPYYVIRQIVDYLLTLDMFSDFVIMGSCSVKNRSVKPGSASLKKKSDSFSSASEFFTDAPDLLCNIDSCNTPKQQKHSHPPSTISSNVSRSMSHSQPKIVTSESHSTKSLTSKLMKLPSAILDKKLLSFSVDPVKVNILSILTNWFDSFDEEIMVNELDPIGVFEDKNVIGRANSYDVIYGTGGTGDMSANIFGTGGTSNYLARSRSDMSSKFDEEQGEYERLSFPAKVLLPILSDILSVECSENHVTSTLTPAMRWRMGDALLVQIMKMVMAEEKIIFIIENLQWCDYQSLSVLFYLLRDTKSGLIIGTERPMEHFASSKNRTRGRYRHLIDSMRSMCHITSLQPLFDVEIHRIMEQIVGTDCIDTFPMLKTEDVSNQISKRTSGIPFAVIALCLALKTAVRKNKFVDVNKLSSGIHNIILNRFDQLSNNEKVVLKIASVIGREFDFGLLKQALTALKYSNCTNELYETLQKLIAAKLIRAKESNEPTDIDEARPFEDDVEPENLLFEFIDQSIQGGIYNLMLSSQREIAHGAIGVLLEQKYNNDGGHLLFTEVVHHYNLSAALEKKLQYLRLAAKNAQTSRDYSMVIHYNTELIKCATKLTLDQLIENCCGKNELQFENHNHVERDMLHKLVSGPYDAASKVGRDLRVVRRIFASQKVSGAQETSGTVSPKYGWLVLKGVSRHFVVIDSVVKLGIKKEDVCRWVAIVADAKSRVGLYHWGNNLSIVALGCLNCSLMVNYSCTSVIKRKLGLEQYRKFQSSKFLKEALLCYENLAFLHLLRGYPEVAIKILKMGTKLIERNDSMWLTEISHLVCRMNALYSLAYLGNGELSKAYVLMSTAQGMKNNHFDAFTNSCVSYISTFHLAAGGSFKRASLECMETIEVLTFIGEDSLAHLVSLSAGWYAFFMGDVAKARDLYQQVFEYGLNTAHRPLIKMSMELYATILIMANDFTGANAILDHIKSPIETDVGDKNTPAPSSIRSSLIAISCVLDARYTSAIPHIQYSSRWLSKMHPTNPICGLFLFFSTFSAIEVLLNMERLEFSERVTANIVMNEVVEANLITLRRCVLTIPCLKLLLKTIALKQCRLDPNTTKQQLIDIDADVVGNSNQEMDFSFSYPVNSPDPVIRGNSLKAPWEGIGDIGMYNEFTLGKLFYHRERAALCEYLKVDSSYIMKTFDSGIAYITLSRHQKPESIKAVANSVKVNTEVESSSRKDYSIVEDVHSSNRWAAENNFNGALFDNQGAEVSMQLDKLRALELEQKTLVQGDVEVPVLRRWESCKRIELSKPRRLLPISGNAKINPEVEDLSPRTLLGKNRTPESRISRRRGSK